ncbi:NADH:ubiquinone oxidoreductase NDUFA2/B8 subunit [Ceraceosorus bombacis]|uniref:NADH:ubiquinone oxidoreductase NDUFA2/B8 subunit n=2 Tax=Ceraceosorus TaxID=401624 RepID=A0A0P1BFR6_9BASI|nr:putative nadh-ubiquinone oxidoreductase 10.5 kDa subunit [Ceraceosorus guamensis]PWN42084.1 putative nadh-ubiquinone oxidoreductase 10.5 kDa subunit [Ceraceosorus guamensis]CEH14899.1 NADH:ubiquinone oxidoreductase NDUFA2/B8 subunit [Ceraceosorus bombacis]
MSSSLARALPAAVKEIRLHLCQTGPASAGVREFLSSAYPAVKQANPDLPFLIREASGTPARIFARFERGQERHIELDGLSKADVEKRFSQLVG